VRDRSMTTHVPQRTCVGCRHVTDQTHLLRWVRDPDDPTRIMSDPDRRSPGRGAWLHPDPECARLALRRGGFTRAFRSSGVVTDLEQLMSALSGVATDGGSSHTHPRT
jgi:predicted RNA-binding protein YlxR (DUF448 family)